MATTSDSLFRLISSMNKEERRKCTLSLSVYEKKKGKTHEMALFEKLSSLKEYDEDSFKKQNIGEGFLKNLSAYKKRLQEKILDGLLEGNAGTEEFEVRRIMEKARILLRRQIVGPARKELKKAKRLAREGEMLEELSRILHLERTILLEKQDPDWKNKAKACLDELAVNGQKIEIKCRYQRLKDRLFIFAREHNRVRDEGARALIYDIFDPENVKDPGPEMGFDARQYYFFARALFEQLLGDWSEALRWQKKQLDWWLRHENIQKQREKFFLNVMNNYLSVAQAVGEYQDFDEVLGRFESYSPVSKNEKVNLELHLVVHQLNNALRKNNFRLADQLENRYRKDRDRLENLGLFSRKMAIYLVLAWKNHLQDDFDTAIFWTDQVLNLPGKTGVREDLRTFAFFYSWLLESEKPEPNLDVLNSQEKKVLRRLDKEGENHAFEDFLLRILRKVVKRKVGFDFSAASGTWLTELHEIQHDPMEVYAEGITIVRLWLLSKKTSKSMKDLQRSLGRK